MSEPTPNNIQVRQVLQQNAERLFLILLVAGVNAEDNPARLQVIEQCKRMLASVYVQCLNPTTHRTGFLFQQTCASCGFVFFLLPQESDISGCPRCLTLTPYSEDDPFQFSA